MLVGMNDDVLFLIVSFLTLPSRQRLSCVNTRLRRLMLSRTVECLSFREFMAIYHGRCVHKEAMTKPTQLRNGVVVPPLESLTSWIGFLQANLKLSQEDYLEHTMAKWCVPGISGDVRPWLLEHRRLPTPEVLEALVSLRALEAGLPEPQQLLRLDHVVFCERSFALAAKAWQSVAPSDDSLMGAECVHVVSPSKAAALQPPFHGFFSAKRHWPLLEEAAIAIGPALEAHALWHSARGHLSPLMFLNEALSRAIQSPKTVIGAGRKDCSVFGRSFGPLSPLQFWKRPVGPRSGLFAAALFYRFRTALMLTVQNHGTPPATPDSAFEFRALQRLDCPVVWEVNNPTMASLLRVDLYPCSLPEQTPISDTKQRAFLYISPKRTCFVSWK
eukprot:Protomagalhaensia_wolfi_Nauph_80__6243@NODE_946_length_1859_cov_200_204396_g714_i0_p1_GENE_NODE_946_length_1859_cov_200_204396_g714_i0NODE_946_length_1859_cov_200_204396_g714_i0_p1_ORF_typecomplete_len387_score49_00Fbox/PF00646_33/7_6e05Fboxlike/PF12937_7/0_44Fboxlike/PF12937_7/6_8e02Fboxlike/PF12937_7/7_5e03_NODE_946_length_1859_cov_200_204396_g714_i01801340